MNYVKTLLDLSRLVHVFRRVDEFSFHFIKWCYAIVVGNDMRKTVDFGAKCYRKF
jgi:hypothetical protein